MSACDHALLKAHNDRALATKNVALIRIEIPLNAKIVRNRTAVPRH